MVYNIKRITISISRPRNLKLLGTKNIMGDVYIHTKENVYIHTKISIHCKTWWGVMLIKQHETIKKPNTSCSLMNIKSFVFYMKLYI